jgi:hypothetical protein
MSADATWSYDPRLDPYRDAVWELSVDGRARAHLLTQVTHVRSLPFSTDLRESMWCTVCWLDGRQDRPVEDYGPEWYTVAELESGTFESENHPGVRFDAKPVNGPLRARLWRQLGPP